jgi:FixJ family two-component response regulator
MSARDLVSRRWLVGVVDDEPLMLRSLTRLLEVDGYAIETFTSARALLDRGAGHMDCLLVDINMPELDGLQLQDILAHTAPDVPIVMMSGENDSQRAVRALDAGAVAFLAKPFDAGTLLATVRVAIDARLLHRAAS